MQRLEWDKLLNYSTECEIGSTQSNRFITAYKLVPTLPEFFDRQKNFLTLRLLGAARAICESVANILSFSPRKFPAPTNWRIEDFKEGVY